MQKQLANLMIDHKITVHTAAIVKSLKAQIEFVKAGVGMALVPSGIERFCKLDEVTFYSFNQSLPKREVVGEVYNIGGHNEMRNIDIVKLICKELGKPESLITYVTDRKGHDMRYTIDPTKIHSELGWLPETMFAAV